MSLFAVQPPEAEAELLVTGRRRCVAMCKGDVAVRLLGDAAVMTGDQEVEVSLCDNDEDNEIKVFATQIWVRDGSPSRMEIFHSTRTDFRQLFACTLRRSMLRQTITRTW